VNGLPLWTSVCLLAALAVTAAVLVAGGVAAWRWRWLAHDLDRVRREVHAEHGGKSHGALHADFEVVRAALRSAAGRGATARVIAALLEPVTVYHDRRSAASGDEWNDILDSVLARERWPLRLARGAAGWVVLIGLAGTVLGFSEALPKLRDFLIVHQAAEEPVAALAPGGEPPPALEGPVTAGLPRELEGVAVPTDEARGEMAGVLDELTGVFYATFGGVVGALLLSVFSVSVLEPLFGRFSRAVDLVGARWLVPLLHAPASLVDESLRGELRTYFDEVGGALERQLAPLVRGLAVTLEQMAGVSTDFTGNIARGQESLGAFHRAVEELGTVARDSVGQLTGIVDTASRFLAETQSLQEEGRQQLVVIAQALSEPVASLAGSAGAIEAGVASLQGELGGVGTSTSAVAQAVDALRQEGGTLQRGLSGAVDGLGAFADDARILGERQEQLAARGEAMIGAVEELVERLVNARVAAGDRQEKNAAAAAAAAQQAADAIEVLRGLGEAVAGHSAELRHGLDTLDQRHSEGLQQARQRDEVLLGALARLTDEIRSLSRQTRRHSKQTRQPKARAAALPPQPVTERSFVERAGGWLRGFLGLDA
jgi:ABC-type transporter Mla subunit MlaD